VFECTAAVCRGKGHKPQIVRCYLDTADHTSTGNLRKHAKICWGEEMIQKGDDSKDLCIAREEVMKACKLKSDGSITAIFS